MHIIAVDDEQSALRVLDAAIRKAVPGEEPACFSNSADALRYAEQNPVDVAFLDVEMKGMNGVELAIELIALYPKVNIIFVTGYDKYRTDAHDMYASGYVKKPVRMQRVQKELSHLRFPVEQKDERFLHVGPFTLDHQSLKVTRDGKDMLLMPREYVLFRLIGENPGIFFTLEELYKQAWGQDSSGDLRTVYSHMYRLRQKLDLDSNAELDIEQQRGKGYRLKFFSI